MRTKVLPFLLLFFLVQSGLQAQEDGIPEGFARAVQKYFLVSPYNKTIRNWVSEIKATWPATVDTSISQTKKLVLLKGLATQYPALDLRPDSSKFIIFQQETGFSMRVNGQETERYTLPVTIFRIDLYFHKDSLPGKTLKSVCKKIEKEWTQVTRRKSRSYPRNEAGFRTEALFFFNEKDRIPVVELFWGQALEDNRIFISFVLTLQTA